MEKTTILFAGPSLYGLDTSKYQWIDVCGPACQSDIYSILNHKHYTRIILADGLYKSIPAPWHKEILLALEMKIEVFGVASLGALRAAELNEYGMKGTGKVYEYINSNIIDDSEVAVMHKPEKNGWEAMTLAHVEVKYWSEKMKEEGRMTKDTSNDIISWSQQTNFERRTKKALIKELSSNVMNAREIVEKTWFSQKKLDLENLINKLNSQKVEQRESSYRKEWVIAKTPYIYRQISKDTSLQPIQGQVRNYGDTLINFLIFVFLEHKTTFQEVLLQVYIEYIEIELTRLKYREKGIEYERFLKLYSPKNNLLLDELFGQNTPTIKTKSKNIRIEDRKKQVSIKKELSKINKKFQLMSEVSNRKLENLCELISEHGEARECKCNKDQLLSPNTIKELNNTVLASLMQDEVIDIEARQAIYYSKQLIDSCSIYTHHGRLRMYTLIKNHSENNNLMKSWEKMLQIRGKGKPHAFFNEEIDHNKLRTSIKDLNEKIKEIQPFPVYNITEAQELLFLEADSIAIIDYSMRA